jgi:hypothetical protein
MSKAAKDKLDEARFFLGHLEEQKVAQAQVRKPPPEHFFYYLSAFLGAAQSVTWVIKGEDEAWLCSWQVRLSETEDDALKKLATDMRNATVHEGRLETTPRDEEVPIPTTLDPYQIHALRAYSLSLRQGGGPWTTKQEHYVERQGKEQEIVGLCERYVKLLARLVKDFEDRHRA